METYDKTTTKFVLTCNDYNKLVEGIQTRCLIHKYNPLTSNIIKTRLIRICEEEKISYDDKGLEAIIFICQGDVRLAINCLEATFFGFSKITYDNVYRICEKPPQIQITALIKHVYRFIFKRSGGNSFKIKRDGLL